MAKSRRNAEEEMAVEDGGKRVRKPGQANASGRDHDEEEHEGNLKFEDPFSDVESDEDSEIEMVECAEVCICRQR
jgi:hypothetical protein